MRVDRTDINQLLSQMRAMKTDAQAGNAVNPLGNQPGHVDGMKPPGHIADVSKVEKTDFGQIIKNAVDTVNDTQKASGALQTAYQLGDPGVSLTQVMVASQKSTIAFQAMTQVRNRVIEAYKDVMNMPI